MRLSRPRRARLQRKFAIYSSHIGYFIYHANNLFLYVRRCISMLQRRRLSVYYLKGKHRSSELQASFSCAGYMINDAHLTAENRNTRSIPTGLFFL